MKTKIYNQIRMLFNGNEKKTVVDAFRLIK